MGVWLSVWGEGCQEGPSVDVIFDLKNKKELTRVNGVEINREES